MLEQPQAASFPTVAAAVLTTEGMQMRGTGSLPGAGRTCVVGVKQESFVQQTERDFLHPGCRQ